MNEITATPRSTTESRPSQGSGNRLGDRPMRLFASAGQQRTAALALRLLECETHRDRTGRQPIVLLDDTVAELDRRRAARVPELLTAGRSGQCILAIPRADDVPTGLPALETVTIRDGELSA